MSHRIIIESNASDTSPQAMHASPSSLSVSVTYTPSHDESDKQVLNRVGRLLRLSRKMQEAAIGTTPAEEDESED